MRKFQLGVLSLVVVGMVAGGGTASGVSPGSAKPDSSLSAAGLLAADGLASGLGEPVVGVEDDGGVPATNGITGEISAARALTQSGVVLSVTLYSLKTSANATKLYKQLSGSAAATGDPIAGAGDESVYGSGQSFVRKGAQVLTVKERPGVALQQQLDSGTFGEPKAATLAYEDAAQKAAGALAAAMSGTAVTKPTVMVPNGGIDLCPVGASDASITVQYAVSERPPAMQCSWTIGGVVTFQVQIVTTSQLASALPPSPQTAQALYDRDRNSGGSAAAGSTTDAGNGDVRSFLRTSPELTAQYVSGDCVVRINLPGSPPLLSPEAQRKLKDALAQKEQDDILKRTAQIERDIQQHNKNVTQDKCFLKNAKDTVDQINGNPLTKGLADLGGLITDGLGLHGVH